MIVDCMTCPVRGRRCDDCVVTMLGAPGSAELPLDAAESRAVSMFVGAGLVSAGSVVGLCAHREPMEHWGPVRAVG
jgi:hypothetical protein